MVYKFAGLMVGLYMSLEMGTVLTGGLSKTLWERRVFVCILFFGEFVFMGQLGSRR